jgi:hypothetical protein
VHNSYADSAQLGGLSRTDLLSFTLNWLEWYPEIADPSKWVVGRQMAIFISFACMRRLWQNGL